MKLKKYSVKACCGKISSIYTTQGSTLTMQHVEKLKDLGFLIDEAFLQAGLIYASSDKVVISGPLGATRITINAKKKASAEKDLLEIERILENME